MRFPSSTQYRCKDVGDCRALRQEGSPRTESMIESGLGGVFGSCSSEQTASAYGMSRLIVIEETTMILHGGSLWRGGKRSAGKSKQALGKCILKTSKMYEHVCSPCHSQE